MDNTKDDKYYLKKIIKDALFVENRISDIDYIEFCESEILQDSMMFRMIQISENSKKLSETFKMEYSNIPWTAIYGLRNRVVHDYGNVDLSIIFDTLKYDIPDVLNVIEKLI